MDKNQIIEAMTPVIEGRGCFLVEVTVSADNDIVISIEKETGIVEMEDCVAVDRAMHESFSQDEEDYSLTVTSAGLDQPFKVQKQFDKAIGTKVDVKFKGGKRLVATLLAAGEDSVTLGYTTMEKPEGKKKKEAVAHEDTFSMEEINSVTPWVDFE